LRQPAATGNAKLGRFLSELSLEKLVLKDIAFGKLLALSFAVWRWIMLRKGIE
jgi:hypothetical protein